MLAVNVRLTCWPDNWLPMNIALRQDVLSLRDCTHPLSRAGTRIAQVDVYDRVNDAEAAWRQLEAGGAIMTPYQRYEWTELWHRHVTSHQAIKPFIIVARDETGAPMFLLPLATRRKRGLVIAGFFGGRHSNLNGGLWRRNIVHSISVDELRNVLTEAAARHGVDLFKLVSQPIAMVGATNPMSLFPQRPTPDDIYVLTIEGGNGKEALKATLKSSMIGRLRTKERKLAALPGYRYMRATTPAEVDRVLDAFFVQKMKHLAAQGICNVFEDDAVVTFLRSACHAGLETGNPVIELFALECDAEVLAVFGGVCNGRRLSCMFNSYTDDAENSRWSPGLVLLTHIVQHCGERQIARFDLGAGHAFYKTLFCKETEGAFDTILGFTPPGRLAAYALTAARESKRRLKATPAVWETLKTVRRVIRG